MQEVGSIASPHEGAEVMCVAVSAAGLVATGGSDFVLRLWSSDEVRSGAAAVCSKELVGHTRTVTCIAFSPDGEHVASCSRDPQDVRIWEIQSGLCVMELGIDCGHDGWVTSLCYSPDGRTLLTASRDKSLILWECFTGELLRRLEGHIDDVTACAFHPAGKLVASAGSHRHDPSVKLWLSDSGEPFGSLTGHSHSVTSIAFNTDNSYLLTTTNNTSSSNASAEKKSSSGGINGSSGSSSCEYYSQTLVSGSLDRTVRVWDFIRRVVLFTLPGHENSVTSVLYRGDSVISASRDGTVKVWEIDLHFAHTPDASRDAELQELSLNTNTNNITNIHGESNNYDSNHHSSAGSINISNLSSANRGSPQSANASDSYRRNRSSLYLPVDAPIRRTISSGSLINTRSKTPGSPDNGNITMLQRECIYVCF